jgi:molecular chaperone GrpE (heat shock protein)
MSLDKKILSEIKRYQSINKYISEQEAPLPPIPGAEDAVADEVTAAIPPTGAGEGAPEAPEAPAAPAGPEKIDIENDPDVEKLDAEGESAEGEEGDGTEELEITDLVTSQKNIEQKQDEYFNNLFGQISKLEAKLSEMDALMNRLNTIENKIEKYREKTPQEKLELRTYDSYPFNQKLSDFFDDKKIEMEKTGKKDYVLTSDEVEDINPTDIRTSFQPGQEAS